jgi:hypothetical protein
MSASVLLGLPLVTMTGSIGPTCATAGAAKVTPRQARAAKQRVNIRSASECGA